MMGRSLTGMLLFVGGCGVGGVITGSVSSSGGGILDPDRPTESLSVTGSTPIEAGPYFGVLACQAVVTDPCDGTSRESAGHLELSVDIGESGLPVVDNDEEVTIGDTITPVGQPHDAHVTAVTAIDEGATIASEADLDVADSVAALEAMGNLAFAGAGAGVQTYSGDCLEGLQLTAAETFQLTMKDRIGYGVSLGFTDDFGLVAVLTCDGVLVPMGTNGS